MTVHLLRMAVRIESLAHLESVQQERMKTIAKQGGDGLYTYTRNVPKRVDELVDGGSIYWVVKRFVRVRQRIIGVERHTNDEGRPYCALQLDPAHVQVMPRPQKAFQGWRYLREEDAPEDLESSAVQHDEMPPEMMEELRNLGLL
jgi:hypothetical protein